MHPVAGLHAGIQECCRELCGRWPPVLGTLTHGLLQFGPGQDEVLAGSVLFLWMSGGGGSAPELGDPGCTES